MSGSGVKPVKEPETVLELMAQSADLDWETLKARCDEIPADTVRASFGELVAAYHGLPLEERFHLPREPLPPGWGAPIRSWRDWSDRERSFRLEQLYPAGATWAVHLLMQKAGKGAWLRWLDSFSEDIEIAAFLRVLGDGAGATGRALEEACKTAAFLRLRSLLLYHLAANPETEDARLAQIIRQNPESLMAPCAEILADFNFLLRHGDREQTLAAMEDVCANERAIALLMSREEKDKGEFAALAALLCRTDAPEDWGRRFAEDYFRWVRRTERYYFQTDVQGRHTVRELAFLSDTAAILSQIPGAPEELEKLWAAKTAVYYGWESDTGHQGNGWFQHFGLLLWGSGQNCFAESGDDRLIVSVLRKTNQFLPSALSEAEYGLLLYNILADVHANTGEINELRVKLIRKVISLPDLLGILSRQMEAEQGDEGLLPALRERVLVLLALPQNKKEAASLRETAEELLGRLEKRLEEKKKASPDSQ